MAALLKTSRRAGWKSRLALFSALAAISVHGALAAPASSSLPSGGSVAAGGISIQQSPNRMDITQSTPSAVINWQSFNIGSLSSVFFHQPGSDSVVLNRIVGQSPSQIFGSLQANGKVFILNPSGIVFGQGAQVNVAGLVASTMSIADADFTAGNYRFTRNGSSGSILNQGTLTSTVDKGFIALLAPNLRNEGVIQSRLGTVALAAGETVVLQLGARLGVSVDPATVQTLIDNRAMILAQGGQVILSSKALDKLVSSAINMSGVIEASSLVAQGGEVRLEAGGTVNVSGKISATGTSGGSVSITGADVQLTGASVDASGTDGGGSVSIGGWDSQNTAINGASILRASATGLGDGGSISVLGQNTVFDGMATARGGDLGGNGGAIETSGHTFAFGPTARIDAGAASGKAGTWLLDPQDLTINSSGASTIAAALATTNVTATTSACSSSYGTCSGSSGDITISSSISPIVTNTGGTALILQANRNITMSSGVSIDATGGSNALAVTLTSNSSGTGGGIYMPSSSIKSEGGAITLNGGGTGGYALGDSSLSNGQGIYLDAATLNAGGGNIVLKGKARNATYSVGIDIDNQSVLTTSGSGTITLTGVGAYSSGTNGFSSGVNIYNQSQISTASGAITLNGTAATSSSNAAYAVSFDATGGVSTARTAVYSTSGAIAINGGSGSIVFATPSGSSKAAIGWDGSGSATTGAVTLDAATISMNSTNYGSIKGGSVTLDTDALSIGSVSSVTTTGAITVAPYTSGTTLGLGTGSGTLGLTNAILAQFSSGYSSYTFGSSTAGALTIGGAVSSFSNPLIARSSGAVTMASGSSLTDTASSTAITLVGNTFVNNGGSLSTSAGRWLVYSANVKNDTEGSLSGFIQYGCSYGATCSWLASSGNGFVTAAAQTNISTNEQKSSSAFVRSIRSALTDQTPPPNLGGDQASPSSSATGPSGNSDDSGSGAAGQDGDASGQDAPKP